MSYKEVRLHLSKGPYAGVAVLRVYPDRVVIAGVERGRLSTLSCDGVFSTEAEAFASARALWLASLPPPVMPSKPRYGRPRST